MSVVDTLDRVIRDLSDLMGHGVSRKCDIETVEDDSTFVLNDGSLMTLLQVDGHKLLVGEQEFAQGIEGLHEGLKGVMGQPGHSLVFHYRYDPQDQRSSQRCISGMRGTARAAGLDLDDLIDDWGTAVQSYTRGESMVWALITRPAALPPQARKSAVKSRVQSNRQAPVSANYGAGQKINHALVDLFDRHEAFTHATLQTLGSARVNVEAEILPVTQGLKMMRATLGPNVTGSEWRPVLPGDRIPVRYKDTSNGWEPDVLHYPAISSQLFHDDMELVDSRTLRWGNRLHRAITVDVPPQGAVNFSSLFARLTSPDYAWNLSIHLDGDGLGLLGWKSAMASLLLLTSRVNRRFKNAVDELKALAEIEGESIVRVRITARVEADTRKALEKGSSEVMAALQAWQACEVSIPSGLVQPVAAAATVPGLLSKSPSGAAAAPLGEVVTMLPWVRPSSNIWATGMPFRTGDGRAFPWVQGSSKQNAFIEIGIGPMGMGKSVNLNAINLAFLLTPGLVRLPWLSILDIGPSSKGLISAIQDALPESQRYLATYVRPRMDPARYSINPFDLPVGTFEPLPLHRDFLTNFLVLLATPLNGSPNENAVGIAQAVIKSAYEAVSNNVNPHLYVPGTDADSADARHLDTMILKVGIPIDEHTSWYDLTRIFFEKRMTREAEIAQRYAVPTLPEVLNMARSEPMRQIYGESAVNEFWRFGMDAIESYPILGQPTRFSLGDARVVSLDLDEVAIKGGDVADRQSAVMFMLARHILLSRFFIRDEDAAMIPEWSRDYHRERIDHIRQDPKRIVFDELHRITRNSSAAKQILSDISTASRESRKWNLHMALYSQDPDDIPEEIAGLATTVFVMGVSGSHQVAKRADDLFSFGETGRGAMMRRLRKPGRGGSHMIARFLVNGEPVIRHLMNTLGPVLLWALSSTTEDARLRDRLYRALGGTRTRQILARLYPGGTVKDLYERMREAHSEGRFLSEEDALIYESLAGQRDTPPDALDVLYEKIIRMVNEQDRARLNGHGSL